MSGETVVESSELLDLRLLQLVGARNRRHDRFVLVGVGVRVRPCTLRRRLTRSRRSGLLQGEEVRGDRKRGHGRGCRRRRSGRRSDRSEHVLEMRRNFGLRRLRRLLGRRLRGDSRRRRLDSRVDLRCRSCEVVKALAIKAAPKKRKPKRLTGFCRLGPVLAVPGTVVQAVDHAPLLVLGALRAALALEEGLARSEVLSAADIALGTKTIR